MSPKYHQRTQKRRKYSFLSWVDPVNGGFDYLAYGWTEWCVQFMFNTGVNFEKWRFDANEPVPADLRRYASSFCCGRWDDIPRILSTAFVWLPDNGAGLLTPFYCSKWGYTVSRGKCLVIMMAFFTMWYPIGGQVIYKLCECSNHVPWCPKNLMYFIFAYRYQHFLKFKLRETPVI